MDVGCVARRNPSRKGSTMTVEGRTLTYATVKYTRGSRRPVVVRRFARRVSRDRSVIVRLGKIPS